MKTHWAADMYPLDDEDVAALAEDIKAVGQQVPIRALKDGRIVDGRTRWRACQLASVEPRVEIINPDGAEVSDEDVFRLVVSLNSQRRDLNTSLRACLAAEAWKRLHPDLQHGGDRKSGKNQGAKLHFDDFARLNFKVGERYAKQALAILNHSAELLERAKENGLDAAYKLYQTQKAEIEEQKRNAELVKAHPDIRDRLTNGTLTQDEALTLARQRERDTIERQEAAIRERTKISQGLNASLDLCHALRNWTEEALIEVFESEPSRSQAERFGQLANAAECAVEVFSKLTSYAKRIH